MKIKNSMPKQTEQLDDKFIIEAVSGYIKKTSFPVKTELHKQVATKAYYDQKVIRHDVVLEEATKDIGVIQERTNKLKTVCMSLITRLRGEL